MCLHGISSEQVFTYFNKITESLYISMGPATALCKIAFKELKVKGCDYQQLSKYVPSKNGLQQPQGGRDIPQYNLYLQDSISEWVPLSLQYNQNNVKFLLCVQGVLSMPGIRGEKTGLYIKVQLHSSSINIKTLQQVTELQFLF